MNTETVADEELLRRSVGGDNQAFDQLIERHASALYSVVRRMSSDSAEAEAIVQEAFLRVWQALPRYHFDRPFFPYLVTIAANLARDRWRKERRLAWDEFEKIAEEAAVALPGPESLVESQELLSRLASAVDKLPAAYRVVVALRYEANMSYEEIGVALNLPINTVRTHLRRAKQTLRKALEDVYAA